MGNVNYLLSKWFDEMNEYRKSLQYNYELYQQEGGEGYLDMVHSYKDRIETLYNCILDVGYYTDIKLHGVARYALSTMNYVNSIMNELYN